jgi:AcrR family transcriptional regulator
MAVKSRRAKHSADTRQALVAAARRLWGQRGSGATSLDEVCARAGVTKGALYHHFRNKEDLFLAVYAQVEDDLVRAGAARADQVSDRWDQLRTAGEGFLEVCARPDTRRVILEAPAVLGWEQARAVERDHALGLLETAVREAATAGLVDSTSPHVLAQLLSAVFHEAGMIVAGAGTDEDLHERVKKELGIVLSRLRAAPQLLEAEETSGGGAEGNGRPGLTGR